MKAENEIDELFREGIQKNYPFDQKLWAQIEKELPISDVVGKKSSWRNTFKLLFLLPIVLFLETDSIISLEKQSFQKNIEHFDYPSSIGLDQKFDLITNSGSSSKTMESSSIEKLEKSDVRANSTGKMKDKWMPSISHTKSVRRIETKHIHSEESHTVQQEVQVLAGVNGTEESDIIDNSRASSWEPTDHAFEPFVEEKSALPVTDILEKLSSHTFYVLPNPDLHPKEIEKFSLNEMQERFRERNYFIEVEYGQSFRLNKHLSGLENGQKNYRMKAENSILQRAIGVNILTDVKRFTVGLGVHMSSFYEQLSYSYNEEISSIYVTYDTSYTLVNDNFNSNGTAVILIREDINENRSEIIENIDRQLFIKNQFKRISLPLSLGYTRRFGRFSTGLRTAIVFNYLYSSSGGYISNNRRNFHAFDESQQLEEWVVGNRNQLRLGYSLNEFVIIGTSFDHQQDLNSFTRDYDSKFKTFGMGVWLQIKPR